MNAPLDLHLRAASLDDKYELEEGPVYLTGTQALVLLPMLQRRRDVAAGLNTAGYISGYRGSPLGTYDLALTKARRHLEKHHVKFVPGLNEDLAATAVWGAQQANAFPDARYDGVFSIWYGKGPGVDRAGDVLRHANQAGTGQFGGVLALAGDDHGAKSSTVAAQTDFIFQAVSMPVLAPATVQDYIDYGLYGIAMSRFSGLWVAIKAVTDTIETAGIVDVSQGRLNWAAPVDVELPLGGLNLRWPEEPFIKLEERLTRYKIPAALAWARANPIDRHVLGVPNGSPARLGIVSTGKAWLDLMQALTDLGIDDSVARQIGLRVYKVGMPWPLEPTGAAAFCEGCEEVLVIEEKRSLVEAQLKQLLYSAPHRPRLIGKSDESVALLLPEWGELSPGICAQVLAGRLRGVLARTDDGAAAAALQAVLARCDVRLAMLSENEQAAAGRTAGVERIPYFCSGCPHNTSTRVPEGSRAVAGIGCSYMAMWMDRGTATFTQMGGEGATWVGQAPFTTTKHVFQNIGDGTYFHSGSLAIRHAVATKTCITYKILFNDAVAMTGGQQHDGQLTPSAIARQVSSEGVERIVVVTDDPDKYPSGYFDSAIKVYHRSALDDVQRELREYPGVSVLIYDQTCAAEKRRRRKRDTAAPVQQRVFINEDVCENCGDCTVKSNCVAVQPVETPLGRKRAINQSSCNSDLSCVEGFCPSFVTVKGGKLRAKVGANSQAASAPVATSKTASGRADFPALPEPQVPRIAGAYSLLVTGIGGTGVITIGHVLGMAAHLEGKTVTVLDMTGLAQKNGAVMSFIRFGEPGQALYSPRIGIASADSVIGCDLIVTAGRESLTRMAAGRTRVVANAAVTPTADFTHNADWTAPSQNMEDEVAAAVGKDAATFVDATRIATALMGDAIATNMFMLGFAWQRGLVPVSGLAIDRAIELNAVAVDSNRAAFAWGRLAAVDPVGVEKIAVPTSPIRFVPRTAAVSPETLIAQKREFLTAYHDAAYGARYASFVEQVAHAERRVAGDSATRLTEAVAINLAKLMAYKDEYEVARLYTDRGFLERLKDQVEGDYKLVFHLAPPLWAKRDAKGAMRKSEYGSWVAPAFRLLSKLRRLRGTPFDVFGYTEERREDRALVERYCRSVEELLESLRQDNLAHAVEIARIPERIRGFGHVRAASNLVAVDLHERLMNDFRARALPP